MEQLDMEMTERHFSINAQNSKLTLRLIMQHVWDIKTLYPWAVDRLDTFVLEHRAGKHIGIKDGQIERAGIKYQVQYYKCGPADFKLHPEQIFLLSFRCPVDTAVPAYVVIKIKRV